MENNNYRKIIYKFQLIFNNLTIKNYLSEIEKLEKISFPNPWKLKEIEEEIEKPYSFNSLLFVNDVLGGYIFSHIIDDEANLNKLCIAEKMRGKGIGSYFLENFINVLKNKKVKKVFLEVRSSNIAAIRLYKKYGFTINRIRKNYYSNSEDAYEMSLEI